MCAVLPRWKEPFLGTEACWFRPLLCMSGECLETWACQKHWPVLTALTPHMNGPFFDHDVSDSVLFHIMTTNFAP